MSEDDRTAPHDPSRRDLLAGAVALSLAAALPEASAGEAPAARKFRFGVIASKGTYWNAAQNFRNLLLDAESDWMDLSNGSRWADRDWGWPRGAKPGAGLVRLIRYNDQPHPTALPGTIHIKPGKYVARTRGGWTVNLRSPIGVTNIQPGKDVCTFTVPEALKSFRIEVMLLNEGRTTLSLKPGDLFVCHVEDEAAVREDPHAFLPEVLENYRGFSIIRNSEVSGVNGVSPFTDAASIPPISHFNGGAWLPEIFAKLCKSVGAGMWINLPTFIDAADAETFGNTGRMRMIREQKPIPAPPNGARVMWTRSDSPRPTGFDLGPYVVCNRDENDQTFQLAEVATPTVAKKIDKSIAPGYLTNMTQLYDWEGLWRAYLKRHHDVYPDPPVVRSEPFLEIWNYGYVGGQMCISLGNHYRTGSRIGGDRNDGQGYFILKSWRLTEDLFGKDRHVRTAATFISGWVGTPLVDAVDVTGEIQKGAKLGVLVRSISPATYYQTLEPAKPPLGTVDFFDPKLNVAQRMGDGSLPENGEITRDKLIAEWRSRGPFSNARWAEMLTQTFHYQGMNLRLWRDKMATLGRRVGIDYDFAAYETGNHQRRDRPIVPQGKDIDTEIQDSFIAFNFGNSPEIRAFRERYRKFHEDNGFALAMYLHMAGEWFRASQQTNQWGSLPWFGAEKTYPELRGWYDFLKANT